MFRSRGFHLPYVGTAKMLPGTRLWFGDFH